MSTPPNTVDNDATPVTRTVPIHYPDDDVRSRPPVSKNSKPSGTNGNLLVQRAAQQELIDPHPTPEFLAEWRVTFRDFAYLPSRHPPIRPYRPFVVQTQPSVRLLGDDDETHAKRRLMRRESTEPVIESQPSQSQQPPANPRALTRGGFKALNLEGDDSLANITATGCSQLSDADMMGIESQSQSQPVPSLTMSISQDTQEDIATPIVTPQGSYIFSGTNEEQDTSARIKAAMHDIEDNLGLGNESPGLPSISERRAPRVKSPPSRASSPSPSRPSGSTLPRTPIPNPKRKLVRATPRTSSQCDLSLPSSSNSPAANTRRTATRNTAAATRNAAAATSNTAAEVAQPAIEGRTRRAVRQAAPRAAPVATTTTTTAGRRKAQPSIPTNTKSSMKRKRVLLDEDDEEEEEQERRAGKAKKAKVATVAPSKAATKGKSATTKANLTAATKANLTAATKANLTAAKGKITKAPSNSKTTSTRATGRTTRNSAAART